MAGAFDRIAHDHILTMLGSFPARGMIRQWLKAGVVEQGRLSRTEEGTPQGGVVSPVLLNVALHGMEQAAGVRYYTTGRAAGWTVAGSPVLITYADDLVASCHSRHEAEQVKARLASWLAPRGLSFNEDKTRVVSLDEGQGRAGARCRRCRRSVSPTRPPNPACVFLRTGFSTGHAMSDRGAGFRQRLIPAGWWLGLSGWPPTARGSGVRDSDIE